ncbi:MAG TPA: PAS domain-containing protein [Sphingomonas sp.]|nr:PAS domain-containing protein [Sphingomonas sp.]
MIGNPAACWHKMAMHNPVRKSPANAASPATGTAPDLSAYFSIAQAIAALLHPHAEVVVHDMINDRIAGIWNAFSSRRVGDPSNLGQDASLRTDELVIGPYDKAERDGRRLKSISASLRDDHGERTGFLCINLDMSKFDGAIEMLRAFATTATPMPDVLFKGDVREQINLIMRDELVRLNRSVSSLTREDRRQIIARFEAAHIFQARNGGPMVAAALGLGRANLYNILRSVREEGAKAAQAPVKKSRSIRPKSDS